MDVVLVHGAGGGAWEWDLWRRVFAAEGIDARAIELVPAPGGLAGTRYEDYARQLRAFTACAGAAASASPSPDALVLVGASLGGLLALSVADDVRARALVLVNPVPPAPLHGTIPARARDGDVVSWGRDASLAGTRRAMPDADAAACAFAWRRWRDESAAVLDAAHAGIAAATPRAPSLVIASACDADVPSATSRALAARLGSSFDLVAGASHVGPLLGRSANGVAARTAGWLCAALASGATRLGPSTRASPS